MSDNYFFLLLQKENQEIKGKKEHLGDQEELALRGKSVYIYILFVYITVFSCLFLFIVRIKVIVTYNFRKPAFLYLLVFSSLTLIEEEVG